MLPLASRGAVRKAVLYTHIRIMLCVHLFDISRNVSFFIHSSLSTSNLFRVSDNKTPEKFWSLALVMIKQYLVKQNFNNEKKEDIVKGSKYLRCIE